MKLLPEQLARIKIDKQLNEAGWDIVSREEYIPNHAQAVKEALMSGTTESDYLLFIDNKAIAVVEAKREENNLGDDVSLYLDFNIIITNLDLVDDEQKKILVSNIKSKILELKELLNERQSHRQHIPNVGKQMFKQQLALVETLEKWIIDFENSLKGQN